MRSGPDWADACVNSLADTGNVSAACEAAGVSRSTFYERRNADTAFARRVREALGRAVDALELEARRRALQGVRREKGVYYLGQQIATDVVTEYSDTLMIFLLKAHRPRKYRERLEHSGPGGGPIPLEMTDDECAKRLEKLLERVNARRAGGG